MVALEYDSSAFAYFAITLISMAGIPLSLTTGWHVMKSLFPAMFSEKSRARRRAIEKATSAEEKAKLQALENKETDLKKNLLNSSMLIRYAILFFMFLALSYFSKVTNSEEGQIAQFDPFKILGIPQSATDKDIKKAYRTLSLTYHPDKWVSATKAEQAMASAKFMKISKAHEALTNEEAKKNYQLYGNPDGRQALEVSFGLPAWIVDKGNQSFVLLFYLITLVIVIPGIVAVYYSKSRKYADRLVLRETLEVLHFYVIRSNQKLKNLPEAIALSAEFRELRYRDEDEVKLINKLYNSMVEEDQLAKPAPTLKKALENTPGALKVLTLIHVHLNRLTNELTQGLKDDLDIVLRTVPMLLDEMLKMSWETLNFKTVNSILLLGQHIYQAIYFSDSPLLQLPHMGENEIKHACGLSGKSKKQTSSVASYTLDMYAKSLEPAATNNTSSRRKGLAEMSESQAQEVEKTLRELPTLTQFNCRVGTPKEMDAKGQHVQEWEDNIVKDDQAAVECVIQLNKGWGSLQNSSSSSLVEEEVKDDKNSKNAVFAHTPYFPGIMEEKWYVIICGGPGPRGASGFPSGADRILGFTEIASSQTKEMKITLRFRTSYANFQWQSSADFPLGQNMIYAYLVSTCYVKLDHEKEISFVLDEKTEKDIIKQHEEDLKIDDLPTIWDEVMQQADKNNDFEDEEQEGDEEENDLVAKNKKSKNNTKKNKNLKDTSKGRAPVLDPEVYNENGLGDDDDVEEEDDDEM